MPDSNPTIWCNAKLAPEPLAELRAALAPYRFIYSDKIVNNISPGIPDPKLAEADIAFGQPDAGQVMELKNLRWVHLSSAGYARYDRQDLRDALKQRGAMLSNSSAVFAEPCAQHALAFILAAARQLPNALIDQQTKKSWIVLPMRSSSFLLTGQTLLIVGFGQIGQRLAELLAPLKMNLIALRRCPRGDEPIPTRPITELDELLPTADHVVNILPASAGTENFFNAPRLARFKPGSIFYNIGRGATVDQAALRAALTENRMAAAFLDVTVPEPLPPTDPLWTTPNCVITPHSAGGANDEFHRAVRHFLANLKRFGARQSLMDRII